MKAELNSDKKEKKKEAVKKVIASMTVGKDVRYVIKILRKQAHFWPRDRLGVFANTGKTR